ncbi:MAG: flagellar biosynthesis regulator FlaF, partial [Pseudomonadota bacterium]
MATNPYNNAPQQGRAPGYTEAWALIEAARRMADSVDSPEPKRAMKEGIRLNWRLWTIFQADLSADESIPAEIRSNLLSLCQFIDKYSVEALIEPEVKHIEALVNINRNIASGLLAGIEAQEQA